MPRVIQYKESKELKNYWNQRNKPNKVRTNANVYHIMQTNILPRLKHMKKRIKKYKCFQFILTYKQ